MTDQPLTLRYHAISDVGRVRKDNQDSGYAGPWLLAVCDGVGGAARGDIASSTAIGELRDIDRAPDDGDLLARISDGLHEAHDAIGRQVDQDPALNGTSTTATVALFDGSRIAIGHVGDSRAYLYRDGELSQLTNDHTFVQSLIDEGRITEAEARVHPHRNLILKALDGLHEVEPDLFAMDLHAGDRLFLCSDGACGVLEDDRMADILSHGSPEYAAIELVRSSLDAGSSDNVTCIVADVLGEYAGTTPPTVSDAETGEIPAVTDVDTVDPPLIGGTTVPRPAADPAPAVHDAPTASTEITAAATDTTADAIAADAAGSEATPAEATPAEAAPPDVTTAVDPADAVPMVVGAAADPKRRMPRGLFRGHRSGDTGELEPVDAEIPEGIDWVIRADPPFDPEAYRYAPRPPRRFTWARRLLTLVILLGLTWIVLASAYWWTQQQYYVGESDGNVVIYRGIDGLPGLSSVYRVSDLPVEDLPEGVAADVADGIAANDYEDATDTVHNLAEMAAEGESAGDEEDAPEEEPDDDEPSTEPTAPSTTGSAGTGGAGGGQDESDPAQPRASDSIQADQSTATG